LNLAAICKNIGNNIFDSVGGKMEDEKAVTGQVKVVFDKEGLEETLRLLRIAAGTTDETTRSASEDLTEILRLSNQLEPLLKLGHLFKIDSELLETLGATHTLCLLEPTEGLREHCAALRVGTLEG
jgi:hypothetical protein